MRPTFERGDPDRPRGHALIFFRGSSDPSVIMASYLIVPPITMDFAKYIPPMLSSQLSAMLPTGPSVVPLPPIPERVESYDQLRRLSEARDDDLLDGGTIDPDDVQRLLMTTTEIAGEYGQLYVTYAERMPSGTEQSEPAALPGVDVDDLLISVMSDSEQVGRLAKLVGTVRYALEGGDQPSLEQTLAEMERVGRHLGASYRVADLVEAARDRSPRSGRLAELLLQRCYKLAAEEYTAIHALDAQIAELKPGE